MRLRNNNKGVAMITAIITIMFIAVLGTSMLAMAFSNYIMKVNNVRAKDNFYNAEIAIDEIKTLLQSAGSKEEVKKLLNNPAYLNAGVFDPDKCFPVSNAKADDSLGAGLDSVSVTVGDIEQTSSSIVLHNVKATSIVDGYESSVTTDIVLSFPKGGNYKLDINDFSLLTDSNINMAISNNATSANIYGYMYCVADPTYSFAGIDSTNIAMCLQNASNVNVLSPAAVINGDVILTDNSCLNLLGNSTIITGDVYLLGNATMVCCSNVRVGGKIFRKSANAQLLRGERVVENTGIDLSAHLVDGSITKGLFNPVQIWNQEGTSYTEPITVADLKKEDHQVTTTKMIGTQEYKAALFQSSGGNSTAYGNGMTNTLLIANTDIKLQSGKYENSTILTSEKIVMDIQKIYITTKMKEDVYEALRQENLALIHPEGMNSISNPKLYVPGTTYEASRQLTYGDLLKEKSETSSFLSALFNAADPTGGTEKVSVGYTNWKKNAE